MTTSPEPTDPSSQAPDELDANDAAGSSPDAGITTMGYEQARDELTQIVATLEGGRAPLQESMRLWERGEALAAHCQRWLDGAQQRIDAAMSERSERSEHDRATDDS